MRADSVIARGIIVKDDLSRLVADIHVQSGFPIAFVDIADDHVVGARTDPCCRQVVGGCSCGPSAARDRNKLSLIRGTRALYGVAIGRCKVLGLDANRVAGVTTAASVAAIARGTQNEVGVRRTSARVSALEKFKVIDVVTLATTIDLDRVQSSLRDLDLRAEVVWQTIDHVCIAPATIGRTAKEFDEAIHLRLRIV